MCILYYVDGYRCSLPNMPLDAQHDAYWVLLYTTMANRCCSGKDSRPSSSSSSRPGLRLRKYRDTWLQSCRYFWARLTLILNTTNTTTTVGVFI